MGGWGEGGKKRKGEEREGRKNGRGDKGGRRVGSE